MDFLQASKIVEDSSVYPSDFDKHMVLAKSLCSYLNTSEELDAVSIHDYEIAEVKKKYLSFSKDQQKVKLNKFATYCDILANSIEKGISIKDKKKTLDTFKRKYRLKFPNEEVVYSHLDDETFVEIYDKDFIQVYRSPDYANITSHSVMRMETFEWWELFYRSPGIVEKQTELIKEVFSGSLQEPLLYPIEDHTVKEINSPKPRSSQAKIVLYCPIYDTDGKFQGGLHFFKVQSANYLDFQVIPNETEH